MLAEGYLFLMGFLAGGVLSLFARFIFMCCVEDRAKELAAKYQADKELIDRLKK